VEATRTEISEETEIGNLEDREIENRVDIVIEIRMEVIENVNQEDTETEKSKEDTDKKEDSVIGKGEKEDSEAETIKIEPLGKGFASFANNLVISQKNALRTIIVLEGEETDHKVARISLFEEG